MIFPALKAALPATLAACATNVGLCAAPAARATRAQWLGLLALVLLAAIVRFWGVGSHGLHAPDEATTAIPALHILEDGVPRFPSGMRYTRAVTHLYLLAGSAAVFGPTEWALRLPSVLCGTALVLLGWLVGRRFLSPTWNLGFAAVVALLPGLIADSQVVRMYIFLIATLAVYAHCVFRWEETRHDGWMLAAIATMIVGIHFHQLAIFGSLLIFYPALVRGDTRYFWRAVQAMVPIGIYFVYIRWTPSEYPLPITNFEAPELGVGRAPAAGGLRFLPLVSACLALALAAGAWLLVRGRGWAAATAPARRWQLVLLCATAVAAAALYYHVAALLLAALLVLGWRQRLLSWPLTAGVLCVLALIAGWQLHLIDASGVPSLRKALGVMVGQPSVWQYAALASFSPVMAVAVALGAIGALWRLAQRQPVPEIWVYFLLAVALPMFVFGLTEWYFPPRYTEFALLPLALTAVVLCQQWFGEWLRPRAGALRAAVIAGCSLLMVNPLAVSRAVNAGESFPDHRAAALYVKSQLQPGRDLVIAEDVLYPWFYLGHVDYWLMGRAMARGFAEWVDGQVVYQYTHTPLVSTAAELQAVIDRPDRGAIYIIASGEDQEDGRRLARGPELAQILESDRFATVFVARDGVTRVWRIPPPGAGR